MILCLGQWKLLGYFIPLHESVPAVFAKSSTLILLEVAANAGSNNSVCVRCSHLSLLSGWFRKAESCAAEPYRNWRPDFFSCLGQMGLM